MLVNVVGGLGQCAKDSDNRVTIRKGGGLPPLVQLLTGTNQSLLINVTKAIEACAKEPDSMGLVEGTLYIYMLCTCCVRAAYMLCTCV